MDLRRTPTREAAAAKAALSVTTGARLDADPRLPSQQQTPRGRRRPDPLAAIWDSEIVPMLEAVPGLRPVSIVTEMLCWESSHARALLPASPLRPTPPRAYPCARQGQHMWQASP